MNALGAYYSYLGKIETKHREKEEHFILATQYYNKASRIDMHEPSTWVGKGEYLQRACVLMCLTDVHFTYIIKHLSPFNVYFCSHNCEMQKSYPKFYS